MGRTYLRLWKNGKLIYKRSGDPYLGEGSGGVANEIRADGRNTSSAAITP